MRLLRIESKRGPGKRPPTFITCQWRALCQRVIASNDVIYRALNALHIRRLTASTSV